MNQIDMNAVAQRLTAHLRDWEAEPNDNSRVGILRRPDGGRIHLRLSNNGARIEVSGVYPTPISYHGNNPMITVSPRRTSQAIARDIEQRFLPDYDKLFAKSWADADNERRRLQEKIEDTQRLADLLGVPYRQSSDPNDIRELDWSEGEFYARVRTENGRVYLNRVSMSLAEFERMVAAIRAT